MYEFNEMKYVVEYNYVENVEDLVGVGYEFNEIREMFGEGGEGNFIVKRNKVIEYLNERIERSKEKGKKSFVIDEEFLGFVRDYGVNLSKYVSNLKRVGNRVFFDVVKNEKDLSEIKKRDVLDFVNYGFNLINDRLNNWCYVSCRGVVYDYLKIVEMVKKLVSWEDLKEFCMSRKVSEVNLKKYERIYMDSESVIVWEKKE